MADGTLSIGQASKRTGLSVKTLRFYSDQGLVLPSARSRSGYRLYSETEWKWLTAAAAQLRMP